MTLGLPFGGAKFLRCGCIPSFTSTEPPFCKILGVSSEFHVYPGISFPYWLYLGWFRFKTKITAHI